MWRPSARADSYSASQESYSSAGSPTLPPRSIDQPKRGQSSSDQCTGSSRRRRPSQLLEYGRSSPMRRRVVGEAVLDQQVERLRRQLPRRRAVAERPRRAGAPTRPARSPSPHAAARRRSGRCAGAMCRGGRPRGPASRIARTAPRVALRGVPRVRRTCPEPEAREQVQDARHAADDAVAALRQRRQPSGVRVADAQPARLGVQVEGERDRHRAPAGQSQLAGTPFIC